MAHQNQLKAYHERESDHPNVIMHPVASGDSCEGSGQAGADAAGEGSAGDVYPMELDEDDEVPFRGFPEVCVAKAARRKRKASAANLPVAYPRRSKRIRKPVEDPDFEYN